MCRHVAGVLYPGSNSGPAKSYHFIYQQVLCVDNLQCAGHVVGVLYPEGEKWQCQKLSFDLSPGLPVDNLQCAGMWLVCSTLAAIVDLLKVIL